MLLSMTHLINQLNPEAVDSNPVFGNCVWQTLLGNDDEHSALSLGYATFPSHGTLHRHQHDDAEFYFCTKGSGIVTIDGKIIQLTPGMALFIPGRALHEVIAGADGLEFVYGFSNQPYFSQVNYQFVAQDTHCVA